MSSTGNYGSLHDSVLQQLGDFSLSDTADHALREPLTCVVADPSHDLESDDESNNDDDDDDDDGTTATVTAFNPRRCLFCRSYSNNLSANLLHMEHKHGFRLPPETNLVVDVETLVKYLHLVVFDFCECLYCGRVRNDVEAIQQHMTGKSHCKIDWEREDSEFKEFCCDEGEGAAGNDRWHANALDETESWTLPSGSVVSSRGRKTRGTRATEVSASGTDRSSAHQSRTVTSNEQSSSKRMIKQQAVFQSQLASLRVSDRSSLMHLPTSMQRAILVRSKRMVEKAQRDEYQMLLRIQLANNKTLKR